MSSGGSRSRDLHHQRLRESAGLKPLLNDPCQPLPPTRKGSPAVPSFIDKILGKSKPTVARIGADLAGAPTRIVAAEAALQHVASMTDAEHAAAEVELAATRRSIGRLQAQVAELQDARAVAAKAEAEDTFKVERAVMQKHADGMKGLFDRYDVAARATADAADAIGEVAAYNRKAEAARRSGLDVGKLIATSRELFRSEPGRVEPDRKVTPRDCAS